MRNSIPLQCPKHRLLLNRREDLSEYVCPYGCIFPIVGKIPRFVPPMNYAGSFGVQWNTFGKVQLDSFTGLRISEERITRAVGRSLDFLKGKLLLEAGCGAGRFTEVFLKAGARVVAVDLSSAVEANYANCGHSSEYLVIQGDILDLPFPLERFDVVVCIGVIQHTPNPEKTIVALCNHVKPGGLLVIDHYTHGYAYTFTRRLLRWLLLKMPERFRLTSCKGIVKGLWPIHLFLWKHRHGFLSSKVRSAFLRVSPAVDYHESYPQLGSELLSAWAILDTHDTLTDVYKHFRSAEEIACCLRDLGMEEIETVYAGNGVEARAKKPVHIPSASESVIQRTHRSNY